MGTALVPIINRRTECLTKADIREINALFGRRKRLDDSQKTAKTGKDIRAAEDARRFLDRELIDKYGVNPHG